MFIPQRNPGNPACSSIWIKVTPLVYAIYFATIDFPKNNPHYTFIYTNYYLKCVYVKKSLHFFEAANKVGTPPFALVYIYLFKMLYFVLQ